MKLWILQRNPHRGPRYDVANGFVVRAITEDHARSLASKNAGDEGENCWLDPLSSSCVALTNDGDAGVMLTDFNAG